MFRFAIAIVTVCLCADVSLAQLFPNAPWNKTYVNSDGCTVDSATGQTLSCPLVQRAAQRAAERSAPAYAESSYSVPMSPMVGYGSTGSSVSYGSSGSSFRVGSVMPDGSVVVSIGSTIDPAIAQAAAAGVEALAIGDRRDFRKSLLEAARKARQAGEITPMEYFALSAASRNPRVLEKMQAAVHEAAIEEGLATTQAIDWSSLIEFIEKLIPIIIKLIDLFSYNPNHVQPSQGFEVTGFDPYTLAA